MDTPFPFYWLLSNTWHGLSPKSKYQKHLKLWPLYVSFVASNGKECAFLILPIISLGHYPFLFIKNLFTSCHKFGRDTFLFFSGKNFCQAKKMKKSLSLCLVFVQVVFFNKLVFFGVRMQWWYLQRRDIIVFVFICVCENICICT